MRSALNSTLRGNIVCRIWKSRLYYLNHMEPKKHSWFSIVKNADHGSSVGTRDPRFIRTVIYAWWLSKYGKRIALHISGLRFSPPRLEKWWSFYLCLWKGIFFPLTTDQTVWISAIARSSQRLPSRTVLTVCVYHAPAPGTRYSLCVSHNSPCIPAESDLI